MSNTKLVGALPDWRAEWEALSEEFSWLEGLRGCPQDPVHHGEGDVWVHTKMVCGALTELPGFLALSEGERQLLFTAALLHDVAKPSCTRQEPDGRISARGHSRRGARLLQQNRERPDGVPEGALGRMLERWEVPDSTEAHAVEWVVRD